MSVNRQQGVDSAGVFAGRGWISSADLESVRSQIIRPARPSDHLRQIAVSRHPEVSTPMSGSTGSRRLTRQELFERVWTTPIRTLAAEFGLSDVGLAKICKKYDIPRPPVGYWARKAFGKEDPRPELPHWDDPARQQIELRTPLSKQSELQRPETTGVAETTPDAGPIPPPVPPYDEDVLEALKRLGRLRPIRPLSQLRSPHPLIETTRMGLKDSTPDRHNHLCPRSTGKQEPLDIFVSKDCVHRALLYFDTLMKAVDKVGGQITVIGERWRRETILSLCGDRIGPLRLRERYRQQERPSAGRSSWDPKWDCVPTGELILEVSTGYSREVVCKDSKKGRLEDKLDVLIESWITQVGEARIAKRKAEAVRRIRDEEERLKRAKELEVQQQREALQRQQQIEHQRVEQLIAEAEAWHQSRRLRAYLRAVEDALHRRRDALDESSEIVSWLQWARDQAERLDPLSPSPASILDQEL